MMVMDQERLFSFGRPEGRPSNQRFGEPHFLSACLKAKQPPSEAFRAARYSGRRQADRASEEKIWFHETAMHVRAMVIAQDTLFVAGPKGDWMTLAAVYGGKRGVVLAALLAGDASLLSEHPLPAAPVYHGMAAAGGSLFLCLQNGSVICFGRRGGLREDDGRSTRPGELGQDVGRDIHGQENRPSNLLENAASCWP